MKEYYLTLRELAVVIQLTPMGISSILANRGMSEDPIYKKKGNNNQNIKLETIRVNRKTVELNQFIMNHKMNSKLYDIDYSIYLNKTVKKKDYEVEFGEYITPAELKNIFNITPQEIKSFKDSGFSELVNTGFKGTRSKANRFKLNMIIDYLPDEIVIKIVVPLFYTIQEVTDILNEKYKISVKKLTVNRKIMELPAIRIRNTIRVSKPVFDSMNKTEIEHIFKKHELESANLR